MDRDIKNKRKEGNKSDRDGLKIEIGQKREKKKDWVGGQNQTLLSLVSCINPRDSNVLNFGNSVLGENSIFIREQTHNSNIYQGSKTYLSLKNNFNLILNN